MRERERVALRNLKISETEKCSYRGRYWRDWGLQLLEASQHQKNNALKNNTSNYYELKKNSLTTPIHSSVFLVVLRADHYYYY